ncbi:MAG: DUF4178 domain-containing protein [Janthinobacterium lividum]
MRHHPCPSCGADVPFRTSISVYAVCASCGSMVVRTDDAVASIGTMAALPEEASALQLGTGLHWADHAYTIIGRVRMSWGDGGWNEWFLDGDGGQAWLAEAQGTLAISFGHPVPAALAQDIPALNQAVRIDGRDYRVADIKQATCVGSEGELPFAAPRGRTAATVDLLSASSGFAGLEVGDGERRFYLGSYTGFEALRFSNLREIEGWGRPPERTAMRALDPASTLPI